MPLITQDLRVLLVMCYVTWLLFLNSELMYRFHSLQRAKFCCFKHFFF